MPDSTFLKAISLIINKLYQVDCIKHSDGGVSEQSLAAPIDLDNCIKHSDGGVSERAQSCPEFRIGLLTPVRRNV